MKLASIVTVLAVVAVGVSARPRGEMREKLQQYLAMVPEDIRAELVNAIRNQEQPSAEFYEKVRQQLLGQLEENQRFREFAEEKYNQFLGMLTPELREEVGSLMENWMATGELPQADEELRNKMEQHFKQLKQSHFEQFLARLSPALREQVQAAIAAQGQQGRPHYSHELRDAIRQHFQKLKEPQML